MSHRRALVSLASTLRQAIPSGVQGSASTTARTSNHLYSSDSHVTDYVAASGMPSIRPGRKVTIHAPPKTPMQSGSAQTLEGTMFFLPSHNHLFSHDGLRWRRWCSSLETCFGSRAQVGQPLVGVDIHGRCDRDGHTTASILYKGGCDCVLW